MASLKRVNKELQDLSNGDSSYPILNINDTFQLHHNEEYQLLVILTRLATYQLKLSISIQYRDIDINRKFVENTYFKIPSYLNKKILAYLPDGKINMEFLINYPDDYPYKPVIWKFNQANYKDNPPFDLETYGNRMISDHTCEGINHSPADTILKNILNFITVNNHFLDINN